MKAYRRASDSPEADFVYRGNKQGYRRRTKKENKPRSNAQHSDEQVRFVKQNHTRFGGDMNARQIATELGVATSWVYAVAAEKIRANIK